MSEGVALRENAESHFFVCARRPECGTFLWAMLSLESLSGDPIHLRFNVGSILREHVGSTYEHSIESLLKPEDASLVSGTIRLTHTSRGVAVGGEGDADVLMMCMRCLNEYVEHVHFAIEEQVHPEPGYAHRRGAEGFEEDDDVRIMGDGSLDLGEIIRQHIVLHLPLKPLCRTDCPGIEEIAPDG